MHILFLTDNFPPEVNASSSRVFERAVYWVKWGYQVTVITCAPNFPEGKIFKGYKNRWYQIEMVEGIRVIRVKTFIAPNSGFFLRTLDFVSYMPTAISAGLIQNNVDVIVATSPQFFTAVAGYFLSFLKRRPFVFELGDLWPASIVAVGAMEKNIALRFLEKLELFLYRRSIKIIALTSAFKEDLISRGIDAQKIKVILNGVDSHRYSPRGKSEKLLADYQFNGKYIVGYIGTLGMAHGLELVLMAAKQLLANQSIHFMLVGAGAEKEKLEQIIKELQLTNVTLIPRQPKENIPEYWSLCDCALVHLKPEPVFATVIPSKLFEAMGMGLPIILASPEGEASRILKCSQAGVWVESGNVPQLVAAILELQSNQPKAQQLRDNALKASKQYTREMQAQSVINLLHEI